MINLKDYWKSFLYLSLFLVISSVISFFLKPVNLGTEFTGGINVSIKNNNLDPAKITKEIANKLDLDCSYNTIDKSKIEITIKSKNDKSKELKTEEEKSKIEQFLKDEKLEIISIESIGTSMDSGMILDVIYSVLIALAFIFFYVLFRFNYKFAISTVLTLLINIILSIAFINLLSLEINLILITSILTIIGYCVNDIIVIYDRIRRNINQNHNMFLTLNEAIKQGKTRSILTSTTTFLASISLFLIPDMKIFNFAATFSFGIIFGTFASLFISTSFLALFKTDFQSLIPKPKDPMHFTS